MMTRVRFSSDSESLESPGIQAPGSPVKDYLDFLDLLIPVRDFLTRVVAVGRPTLKERTLGWGSGLHEEGQ